jgi:hypothetical protein
MSIGLSRNARLLLVQLVQVQQRGKLQGLSGDQLSFTLSVDSDRTTVAFASDDRPVETSEVYAADMLRANGLIEEFTTIKRTSDVRRYVVTQAAVLLVDGSTTDSGQDATMRRRTGVGTTTVCSGRAATDARVSSSTSRTTDATTVAQAKRSS